MPPVWLSLILIFACQGNGMAQPWSPSPEQVACDKGKWGYTEALLDFVSLADCNTAGHRFVQQQPHVYVTWRCVVDSKKSAEAVIEDDAKRAAERARGGFWAWLGNLL